MSLMPNSFWDLPEAVSYPWLSLRSIYPLPQPHRDRQLRRVSHLPENAETGASRPAFRGADCGHKKDKEQSRVRLVHGRVARVCDSESRLRRHLKLVHLP